MTACPICEKHTTPIDTQIHRGEHAALVHYPVSEAEPKAYKGHLMVELHRHVTSFGELTDAEAAEVGVIIARGVRLLTDQLGAEHTYVFSIGHLVPHLHIHLVARYPGTPEEFWDGKKLSTWPEAPMLDHAQVLALAAEFSC
ncbi:MAG: HIT family protein [Planctomycetes bacterium]|nr:HIT family protein [Planctomycetota bacterium]